jgi:hypothetical protein
LPNINWIDGYDVSSLPPHESRFITFIIDNGLHQLVHEATRLSNTLDLLLVNNPLAASKITVTAPFSTSDHNALTWQVWLPGPFSESDVVRYNFRRANYDALSSYLGQIDWVSLFTSVAPDNVNGLWLLFKRVLCDAIERFVPHVHTRTRGKRFYPLYIRRALKRKHELWRNRHCNGGSVKYKSHADTCRRLIKRFHKVRERHTLEANSISAFYRHVNSRLYSGRFCNNR